VGLLFISTNSFRTSTSSFRLNLVEFFFGLPTEKQLRRDIFISVKELEKTIVAFIKEHYINKKSFVWAKSAEEILN